MLQLESKIVMLSASAGSDNGSSALRSFGDVLGHRLKHRQLGA